MAVANQAGALVRGADGVLYDVSGGTCEPVPAKGNEAPTAGTKVENQVFTGSSDYAASSPYVDPGDLAA